MKRQIVPLNELPTVHGFDCTKAEIEIVEDKHAISRTVWATPMGMKEAEFVIEDLRSFMNDDNYRRQLYGDVVAKLKDMVRLKRAVSGGRLH